MNKYLRYSQLLLLLINFIIIIYLTFCLKQDGYEYHYVLLGIFLALERAIVTLKIIRLTLRTHGLYSVPLGLSLSVLCMDISLGSNLDDEYNTYFEDIQFNEELNYTVHYLNIFPLIMSFQVLADQGGNTLLHPIYLILIFYGIIHAALRQIICISDYSRNTSLNNFKLIWEFVKALSRVGCFCAFMGELLSVSNYCLVLVMPYLLFELYLLVLKSYTGYSFSTLFQIQTCSSQDCLENSQSIFDEYYILSNAFQALYITMLFMIRTATHPYIRAYDIAIYLAMVVYLPSIISQIFGFQQYLKYGPFYCKEYLTKLEGIDNQEQQLADLQVHYDRILNELNSKYLMINYSIFMYFPILFHVENKENIQFFDFLLKILQSIKLNGNLSKKHPQIKIQQASPYPELSIVDCRVRLSVCGFEKEKITKQISLIQDELVSSHRFVFVFDVYSSEKISLMLESLIISEIRFVKWKSIEIFPPSSINCIYQLFRDILQFTAASKVLYDLLPINPFACMFDLYEDFLTS